MPVALSEKQSYSAGRRWVYICNRRKAKKEIPVLYLFHECPHVLCAAPLRRLEEQIP